MHFKRSQRVGGLIQKEISDLLATKVKDPRLNLVTITGVKVSGDLRFAQIYFSVVEGKERSQGALVGFESAKGYLKRQLSRILSLKHMPELRFVYDESLDRAAAMNRILKAIESENNATVGEPAKE